VIDSNRPGPSEGENFLTSGERRGKRDHNVPQVFKKAQPLSTSQINSLDRRRARKGRDVEEIKANDKKDERMMVGE